MLVRDGKKKDGPKRDDLHSFFLTIPLQSLLKEILPWLLIKVVSLEVVSQ